MTDNERALELRVGKKIKNEYEMKRVGGMKWRKLLFSSGTNTTNISEPD